jgi:putative FmdB family regulatory protein
MPLYGYCCTSCDNEFDRFLAIDERDRPLNEECDKCKNKTVVRNYTGFTQPIAVDVNNTPNKKTNGQWSQLMNKMKKGISPKYHDRLDRASDNRGTRWH